MFKISIKFIVLMAAAYVFAIIQGGNLPYRIFHGFLLTFITGLIFILLKLKSISIKIKFDKTIYNAGDEYEFTTIVGNFGMLPVPSIMIKNQNLARFNPKYNGDIIALNPTENRFIKSQVRFNKRGLYDFGQVELSISDLFYIFERRKSINLGVPVKVYPKIYELNKFIAHGSDIFKNAVNLNTNIEDLYSVKEIRKYSIGDNLKRVNWKVSAKKGELYVRSLDTVSGEESNLFLDMSRYNSIINDNGLMEEQLVDLCVSIVNFMQLRGIKTKLFINGASGRRFDVESRKDFNELMEYFITQDSDGEGEFHKFIDYNLESIPRLSWIGIVVSEVNKELKDKLVALKDKGYNITVFYSAGSLKDLSNMELLKKIGIDSYGFNQIIKKSGGVTNS